MRVVKLGLGSGLIGALLAGSVSAQSFSITNDTFIDSGSPGTFNTTTGQYNVDPSISIVNGMDIYSYGADGKVKAVASGWSSSYKFPSYTHTLFTLPQSFWNAIGTGPVSSAVVTFYLYNDSLSTTDTHTDLEVHPLHTSFTTGDGSQNKTAPIPSTDGGATWDTTDGKITDAWSTPGGDYDSDSVLVQNPTNNPSWLPNTLSQYSPVSWNIAPLLNNSQDRADLEANGALIKVVDETDFPAGGTQSPGVNDFVSILSSDYLTAAMSPTTSAAYLPTVSLPEPASAILGMIGLAALARRRRA